MPFELHEICYVERRDNGKNPYQITIENACLPHVSSGDLALRCLEVKVHNNFLFVSHRTLDLDSLQVPQRSHTTSQLEQTTQCGLGLDLIDGRPFHIASHARGWTDQGTRMVSPGCTV